MGRIFQLTTLSGPHQMALDMLMLEKAISNSEDSPSLRFYLWDGAWLSIGKNQRNLPRHWISNLNKGNLKIVRRPSGGNGVLHAGGLTYSLVWPRAPRQRHSAYVKASKWLIKGFSKLGIKLQFGNQDPNSCTHDCFSTSTEADLVDSNGQKRIGSAQLWRKGYLLQHGEILLNPPKKLWEGLFQSKPPEVKMSVTYNELTKILTNSFKENWPYFQWEQCCFSKEELLIAKKKSNQYQLDLDNSSSSTIPIDFISATTCGNAIPKG